MCTNFGRDKKSRHVVYSQKNVIYVTGGNDQKNAIRLINNKVTVKLLGVFHQYCPTNASMTLFYAVGASGNDDNKHFTPFI